MANDLIVPPVIEAVIKRFDQASVAVDEHAVQQALGEARTSLANPTAAENLGAWAELLAFALVRNTGRPSPWKTYFGPMGTGDRDGKTFYFPDITGTDACVVSHWTNRARDITHPVLRARYADLAWDMSRAIANVSPNPAMARTAIDAYLTSLTEKLRGDEHARFDAAVRALNLAVMIRDETRTTSARTQLLHLHREAIAAKRGLWWIAVDRLIDDKKVGVTDAERDQLVADMEVLVEHYSTSADPTAFDPHATEGVSRRLIKYYNRTGKAGDAARLHEVIGRAFEHFASLGTPMTASYALQIAINAYRDAGLAKESRRVRIEMETTIRHSQDEMVPITTEMTVSKDDIEKFVQTIVTPDLAEAFARIAVSFIDRRSDLETLVEASQEQSPLMATISQTIFAENRVAAKVGSVEEDPFGRLVRQAAQSAMFSDIWLFNALNRAIETHSLTSGHFAGWAGRNGLYADLTLIHEGVGAWFNQDYLKAVHILVPQIEHGLRSIASKLGLPVTKAHPTIDGVGVAINMGDILYSKEITAALGPDLTLYLLALYADPRGLNLRNNIAHGLIEAERIDYSIAMRVVHTVLVIGLWKEIAEARR